MENIVTTYGYPAIVGGTFLEGETIVLAGGYLASRDYLSLPLVALCAFLGSWMGDTLYFFIGRRWGGRLLGARPSWRPAVERALRLLHRHDIAFILSFRFIYGIRTVSPFVIGMSGVSPVRFVLLNMAAAGVWAAAFATGGYLLGEALSAMITHIERYEMYFLAVLIGVAMLASIAHLLFAWRRRQRVTVRAKRQDGAGRRDDSL